MAVQIEHLSRLSWRALLELDGKTKRFHIILFMHVQEFNVPEVNHVDVFEVPELNRF